MDVPTLDDTMPDNERLTRAIREITGMQRVKLPYSVIHKMAQVLREHNFDVNVVIRKTEKDIFVMTSAVRTKHRLLQDLQSILVPQPYLRSS